MNERIEHYLKTVADILHSELSTIQLDKEQLEDLVIASRLLDCVILETSNVPQAGRKYLSSVQELLPEIEKAIESKRTDSISSSIADLREFNSDSVMGSFDTFQSLVTNLQKILFQQGGLEFVELAKKLMACEALYADTLFSAGQELANQVKDERSGGAANVRNYDENALRKLIVQKFPDEASIEIEKSGFISGGQSKFTLGIDLSGAKKLPGRIILRGDGEGQFSGAGVADEFRLQQIMFNTGVSVPEPLALEETGEVFGSPFMLSACAAGDCIGHMFKMPEPDEQALVEIAQNLAKIHAIDTKVFGDSIDNATNPTSEKVLEWLEIGHRDLHATGFNSSVFETAFSWLKENVAINDSARRVLVHGDYGLNNILIENSRVTAILDWEFAHIGNPAYDLAYFYHQAQALGSWDLFIENYAASGQALPDQDQLNYCIVLANTRLGVQCVQAHTAFNAGLIGGPTAGRIISNQYVNESILRISSALKEVL